MTQAWITHAVGSGDKYALLAKELTSGKEVRNRCPRGLFVAFPAHQILQSIHAIGCPQPTEVIDLFAEHRVLTNTAESSTADPDLVAACNAWGVPCKVTLMDEEAGDPMAHCRAVVDAVSGLFRAISFDHTQALRRGQYAMAVAAMQHRGIPISQARLNEARALQQQLQAQAKAEYPQCFPKGKFSKNLASRWLRGRGARRVNTPSIDWCRRQDCPEIRRAGELATAIEKLDQMRQCPIDHDSRSRVDLRPYAAVTGRNQPRGYSWQLARYLIEPPPGRALAIIDYAQQEFAIAANLSGDETMTNDYYTGDAYENFGRRCGVEGVHPRETLKQAVLSIMYGRQSDSLSLAMGISRSDAQSLLAAFNRSYPRCRELMEEARRCVVQTGMISTASGWALRAPAACQDIDQLRRTAANFPIQANGTEILWEACRRLHIAGIELCGTLHDAVMVEADEADIGDAVAEAEELMRQAATAVLGRPLRTKSETLRHGGQFQVQQAFKTNIDDLLAAEVVR